MTDVGQYIVRITDKPDDPSAVRVCDGDVSAMLAYQEFAASSDNVVITQVTEVVVNPTRLWNRIETAREARRLEALRAEDSVQENS